MRQLASGWYTNDNGTPKRDKRAHWYEVERPSGGVPWYQAAGGPAVLDAVCWRVATRRSDLEPPGDAPHCKSCEKVLAKREARV